MNWLKIFSDFRGTRTNERGNIVHSFFILGDRYRFDVDLCRYSKGWKQYDTDQDAGSFGIWVHLENREIVTFAEGDVYVVKCPDDGHLQSELNSMGEFYGDPPPAMIAVDADGSVTHVYDPRPEVRP